MDIIEIAKSAHDAFLKTMTLSGEIKNLALLKIAQKLEEKKQEIISENKKDLDNAKILLQNNEINQASYDRLKIDENKINVLIKGLADLVELNDPVNFIEWEKELDEDLILKKVRVPIGVIGVIFESRPDCYIQIASLLIKSGNCGILKGGKEASFTNTLFASLVNDALCDVPEFPKNAVNLIYSRDDIKKMLELDEYIDLIIPRGSNALVKYIKENTRIPVLGHASGICHLFLDEEFSLEEAKKIIIDSKTQYPSACNALETLLIHQNYPKISELKEALVQAGIKVVENPESYSIEYGDKILSLKIVSGVDEAINHINKFGSHHTESILSNNKENIEKFMQFVDSSSIFNNCSTRFSDGFRYGFGAEVGISTNKTHARGPVGLEGLTIYKYKLFGQNSIVADYATGKKEFHHKFLT
ncbi:glutamate-5-semialdehyde dehydrogenase [bacterium]|nr:glutamate-5-semialdehyde dehydrogenase [bacterium]